MQINSITYRFRFAITLLFVLWCSTNSASVGENKACCEDNEDKALHYGSHKCINGDAVRLNCSGGFKSLLDADGSKPENFYINPAGQLIVNDTNGPLEYTQFCLARLQFDNGSNHRIALICVNVNHEEIHVFTVLLFISSIFLFATTIIYITFKELRDVQGICILNFIINLCITYVILGIIQFPMEADQSVFCSVQAHFLYFFSLCAFFWMNISSFNMWKSAKGWYTHEGKTIIIYALICYGFPTLFLVSIIILQNIPGNHSKPNFGLPRCWFRDLTSRWWYYYSIMSILLILNVIYFLDSSRILWKTYREQRQLNRIRSLRFKFCLYLKLFLIMGISWCFEILTGTTIFKEFNTVLLITDIVNCLQGLVIFIVLILTRKRVMRLLAKKHICPSICFRRSWIQEADNETEDINDEDIEVTKQTSE